MFVPVDMEKLPVDMKKLCLDVPVGMEKLHCDVFVGTEKLLWHGCPGKHSPKVLQVH